MAMDEMVMDEPAVISNRSPALLPAVNKATMGTKSKECLGKGVETVDRGEGYEPSLRSFSFFFLISVVGGSVNE